MTLYLLWILHIIKQTDHELSCKANISSSTCGPLGTVSTPWVAEISTRAYGCEIRYGRRARFSNKFLHFRSELTLERVMLHVDIFKRFLIHVWAKVYQQPVHKKLCGLEAVPQPYKREVEAKIIRKWSFPWVWRGILLFLGSMYLLIMKIPISMFGWRSLELMIYEVSWYGIWRSLYAIWPRSRVIVILCWCTLLSDERWLMLFLYGTGKAGSACLSYSCLFNIVLPPSLWIGRA